MSSLVLSPIVTRPAAQQQHRVSWVVVGGPSHYVVTPTRVEVELRLSWAVTIENAKNPSVEVNGSQFSSLVSGLRIRHKAVM